MRSLISHRMLLLSWSRKLRVRIAMGNQIEVMTAETRNALGCPSFSAPPDTRMANINLTAITEIADVTGRGVLGTDCATYLRLSFAAAAVAAAVAAFESSSSADESLFACVAIAAQRLPSHLRCASLSVRSARRFENQISPARRGPHSTQAGSCLLNGAKLRILLAGHDCRRHHYRLCCYWCCTVTTSVSSGSDRSLAEMTTRHCFVAPIHRRTRNQLQSWLLPHWSLPTFQLIAQSSYYTRP